MDAIERAVTEIAAGRPVVVVDDPDRENEGDLVFAASSATPELVGFTVRYTSGVICVPMQGADLDRLKLPPMTTVNEDPKGTAYATSVDARHPTISTGISAHDRALTCRTLADAGTTAQQLTRPGHIFPLRAVPGGVLNRRGHTEAAVDLARLAGQPPVGVIAELVADDGSLLRLPQLRLFAADHGLAIVSITDLVAYRQRRETRVERAAEAWLPTRYGQFRVYGYRDAFDGLEHVALVHGDLGAGRDVPVSIHLECLTGDVAGSLRCQCRPQLAAALECIASRGRGVLLYLRRHESRGVGLLHKLRAYQLQEQGREVAGAPVLRSDARDHATCAHMLTDLGVQSLWLLNHIPGQREALQEHGLRVLSWPQVVEAPARSGIIDTDRRALR